MKNKIVLSKTTTNEDEHFYFGGESLLPENIQWPISSDGNSMTLSFTISTTVINQYLNVKLPINKIISIFSDNDYLGNLCESPDRVAKDYSKVILSNIGSPRSAPKNIEVYPKRYCSIEVNDTNEESFIGGKPKWLQHGFEDTDSLEVRESNFLFQMYGGDIAASIGTKVVEKDYWYITNDIYEDLLLYVFLKKDILDPNSAGFFFLQMT